MHYDVNVALPQCQASANISIVLHAHITSAHRELNSAKGSQYLHAGLERYANCLRTELVYANPFVRRLIYWLTIPFDRIHKVHFHNAECINGSSTH